MASYGRAVSVRVTCSQASARLSWAGSASRSSRRPVSRASGSLSFSGSSVRVTRGLCAGQVDESQGLDVAGLGEGVGQRGSAVVDAAR